MWMRRTEELMRVKMKRVKTNEKKRRRSFDSEDIGLFESTIDESVQQSALAFFVDDPRI